MSPHRLTDMSTMTVLGGQLCRFEPSDILRVIEQMAHHSISLLHTNRESGEDNLLRGEGVRGDEGEGGDGPFST
jgi:hypothetical protein